MRAYEAFARQLQQEYELQPSDADPVAGRSNPCPDDIRHRPTGAGHPHRAGARSR